MFDPKIGNPRTFTSIVHRINAKPQRSSKSFKSFYEKLEARVIADPDLDKQTS